MTRILHQLRQGRLHPLAIGLVTFAVTVATLLSQPGAALA